MIGLSRLHQHCFLQPEKPSGKLTLLSNKVCNHILTKQNECVGNGAVLWVNFGFHSSVSTGSHVGIVSNIALLHMCLENGIHFLL